MGSAMRILLVADVSAETVHGGAERMLHHHVRAIDEARIKVSILTRQPAPDAPLKVEVRPGVTEYRLPFSGDKGVAGMRQLLQEASKWWGVHAGAFDMVVAEQPFVMWALYKAGCRLPRLQVCYSFAYEEYATRHGLDWNWKHRLATAAMRRLEGSVYRSAERLLVLSEYTRRRLAEAFGIHSEVAVVPGGVDVRHSMKPDRREIRASCNWEGPVVVTLRNLVPRTGVDLLVQTAAMVRVHRPDVRWCVVGTGPLLEPLRHLAGMLQVGDIVSFCGFLSEKEVHRTLNAADIFLLPTRALEGFGLVTIEANAAGLPVVATPVGANPEVVASLPHNRLAADATPEALADAVLAMLDELPEDREPMRAELHRAAADAYAWEHHDEAFIRHVKAFADR